MTTHPAPLHASPDVSSFHTIRSEEEGGGDEDDDEEEEEEEDSEGEEVRHPLLPSHISNEQAASFSSYHPADVRPLATFVNGGAQQHLPNGDVRITMDPAEAEAAPLSSATERYPRELLKTLLAFVFLIFSWVTTGISLALVHENRPETPPLPDQVRKVSLVLFSLYFLIDLYVLINHPLAQVLDHVIYQQWALFASEYLIQFQTFTAVTVMLFHRHRWIVGRRSALLIGVLYLYRAFTMWVTVLPKADAAYPCAPKAGQNLTAGEVAERAFKILTGMGLSINGQHVFCGDYIYSGHTVMIIMGYLIVKECEWMSAQEVLPVRTYFGNLPQRERDA